MVIDLKKLNIFDILLLAVCFFQFVLIGLGLLSPSDSVNHLMFITNYVVGFLIIANLARKSLSTHYLAIAFFGCYMLFLMGQKPFEPDYDVFLTFSWVKLSTSQYFSFSCILFFGLFFAFGTYLYCFNKKRTLTAETAEIYKPSGHSLRRILTLLLVITLPCAFYMQGKIVLVRAGMSYTSGYLINVDIPGLIKVGYYIYSTVVLLYLALKPSKGKLFFILFTYLIIEGGLQLFQGRRALFASTLLFILWYLLKYYKVERIKLKYVLIIFFIASFLLVLFYIVEQARSSEYSGLSLDFIKKFLISTGGSDSVIANTIYRKNDFPASGAAYLFDPLINNPIGNLLLGKPSSAQGMTYLQQHHSFSHWISYMTQSYLYLTGHGMGSCYLAEVYLAYGMVGVILASMLVGWSLNKVNGLNLNKNIFLSAFIFYIVKRIFSYPRDGFLSWTGNLIYLLFTYILLFPLYQYSKRK